MNLSPRAMAKSLVRSLRRYESRNLFWWAGRKNFGDLIGPVLFKALSGEDPIQAEPSNRSLRTVHLTVGSILPLACENSIVWGSGLLRESDLVPSTHNIHAVRGPLTRNRVLAAGFECPEVLGDPGILVSRFFDVDPREPISDIGIVPHFHDLEAAERMFGGMESVRVIDVGRAPEVVISEIARCRRILASSLHGGITAHAFGVPAAFVMFSDLDRFKFEDYLLGVEVHGTPETETIDAPRSAQDLAEIVDSWPQPDPETFARIGDDLLAACPFASLALIERDCRAQSALPSGTGPGKQSDETCALT